MISVQVLKTKPERRGFQHLPRGPADVNVSEKATSITIMIFYCIKTFLLENFGEIASKSSFSPVPIMARKSTLPANVLKTPLPGQRLTALLLCTLLTMTSVFMTAPECLFVKPKSRASTARELP